MPNTPSTPPYPGTPRWVKLSGLIALVLILLIAVLMFTGLGAEHGPGRHLPPGGSSGQMPLASVIGPGVQPL